MNTLTLPTITLPETQGFRLINSKLPPIAIFNDVASPEEFADLYALQAMTNPRLQQETGDLNYIDLDEIPWGIAGCHYAVAPFTHVNPEGSRFSNGDYGVLYIADTLQTALAEVTHHQRHYLANIEDLKFDRIVLRGLACTFTADNVHDATQLPIDHDIYHPDSYAAARALGSECRANGSPGIQYHSVRQPGATCWGLFTPRIIQAVKQSAHYELIVRDGNIIGKKKLVSV